ncbi:MAG: SMC-Scp complex subunit ScpB, partial [Kiritimatiellaeota bacterium]|nr:SMC-Scp complex subunit ScpB [Kiritimatiellota bacterium]
MLEKGRTAHLSRPALETLAIIAYRQPCTRSEIEAVRGVAVDSLIHNLLELQLIKVVGRSELPGKPWQYGTTQAFLEHFGLRAIDDLPGVEELRRMEAEQIKRREE